MGVRYTLRDVWDSLSPGEQQWLVCVTHFKDITDPILLKVEGTRLYFQVTNCDDKFDFWDMSIASFWEALEVTEADFANPDVKNWNASQEQFLRIDV